MARAKDLFRIVKVRGVRCWQHWTDLSIHYAWDGNKLSPHGSAIALSQYLCTSSASLYGWKVVELGSGCGLVGLTAAAQLHASVVLTDIDTLKQDKKLGKLEMLRKSVLENGVGLEQRRQVLRDENRFPLKAGEAVVRELHWEIPEHCSKALKPFGSDASLDVGFSLILFHLVMYRIYHCNMRSTSVL